MDFNNEYNDVIKAALKATLHDKQDYLVYMDEEGTYSFIRGEQGKLPNFDKNVKILGWTEFSVDFDIPKASYLELEHPMMA